ncbi:MAG: GAF domain-containing protein, partial [Anaerolineae bacterium]|nr:GAF domain-containing protein [Anaerolineae bacterium]
MELAILLFAGAVVILLWLFFWSRQRMGQAPDLESVLANLPLVSSGDAVLVTSEHGQVLHANDTIRRWLGTETPDLETIARNAQPSDTFLELFTREAQASFQLGKRWVEAVSHRAAADDASRMVIVMRELSSSPTNTATFDLGRAITVANEIDDTVNASLGIEMVVQALLTIVGKELPMDAGEICLWDEAHYQLTPRGWMGDVAYVLALAEAGGNYAFGEGITGWIAQYRKPVLVVDVADKSAVRPKLHSRLYRSYIGVPLIVGEHFIGTLEFATADQFSQADLSFLQAIAKQGATAIYNAPLYTEQARRIEDLATVQQAIDQSGQESTQVFSALTERVAKLLDAEVCGVLIYDDIREALVAQPPFYGLPAQVIRNFAIPVPEGSIGYDIWKNQPFWLSSDLADEPMADELRLSVLVNAAGLKDTILMPLQVGSRRIGMMQVSNKRSVGGFTPQDLQNLRLLSSQVAVAVEDLRLAEREQIHDAEMSGLQEIAQAFGAIHHSGEFFANINERIARVMGIAICGILLHDEANRRLVAQKPFTGLDDSAVEGYVIDLKPGTAIEQIWRDDDYWYSNSVATDLVIHGAGLADTPALASVQKTLLAVMASGGRRLGMVQVSNKRSGEDFTDNDARLLLIFAAQIAGMIENSRLLREVQDRADESEGLRRVAEFAGAVMTAEDDFLPTLREICRLTSSPASFINVLDPQTGNLVGYPKYGYGFQRTEPFIHNAYNQGYERSVAIARRPFFSNTVADDARVIDDYRAAALDMGIRAVVMVPLVVGDQSLGELGVFNRGEPAYSEDDVRNLQAIAIHVAAALDRVRLHEATGQNLRRRLQELDAISRVSNELTATLDFDRVLDVIRHEATQATDAEGNTIALLLPASEWLSDGVPRVERRLGERKTLTLADIERQAAQHGAESVLVEDYQLQDMTPIPETARSAVAAAFVFEDRVIGVIHLFHSQPFHFDDRAATFLMTLAAKAALSYGNNMRYLENQERGERLRRRVEQLNQIFELGQMLQSNVDTGTILEAIAFSIQQSIGFDVVMILMVDEESGILRRIAQAGLPVDAFEDSKRHTLPITTLNLLFEKEQFRISESYFLPFQQVSHWYVEGLEAISTGRAVTRTMHPQTKDDWHDGDMLVVPVMGAGGDLLGVISLDRPFDGRRPDRGAVEILEIFAHQAATTLENTRLYMNTVRNAEQEARLNEVMEAIASTLDMTEIIQSVARGALRLLPFMRMTVGLLETEHQGFDVVTLTVRADESLVVTRDHRTNLNQTALGRTFETGQDYLYGPGEDSEFSDLRGWHAAGERTSLIVPLITGGIVLGAMHLGSDLTQAFGFEEFRPLIKRIANLTAVAIQNARLFETSRTRTERLSLLNRVSVALAQSLDVENVMEIALREISNLLRIDRARAYIFERDIHSARVIVEHPRGDFPPSDVIDLRASRIFEHVMRTAQPLVVPDVANFKGDETLRAEIQRLTFPAYLVLPLTVGGQVSGALELEVLDEVREFEREKLELATIIANQSAIAVLNANLLEQTLVRTRELETLLEAAQATSYTLDLDEVYSGVVRLALQALDMDDGVLMIYDNVEEMLIVQYDMNRQGDGNRLTPSGTSYDLYQYPTKSRALQTGQIMVARVDDPDCDPKERAEMTASGETARMLVPLIVRDQAIGLLQIEMKSSIRSFTHRDIRMAQALGAQAATAIENARLSTQTAALVEQSLVINDISRTISSTMNTGEMIEIVRDQIPSLLEADEIYVALYDGEKDEMTFPLAMKGGQPIDMPPRPLGKDEFSFIVRQRRPVTMGGDNPGAGEVRRNLGIVADVESTRFLGVPLMAGDQAAGVLAVRDTIQTRAFGLNDNRILTTIAAQLGATLQNAQLFERVQNFAVELNQRVEERTLELQEERDRLNSLYQITAELGRTLDTDRVLTRALDMVARAVGADDGVVMLINQQTEQLYSRAVLNTDGRAANGSKSGSVDHPGRELAEW